MPATGSSGGPAAVRYAEKSNSMSPRQSALAFSALLLLAASTAPLAAQEEIFWHDNYADAIAEAQQTGKPIFLEFRCAP